MIIEVTGAMWVSPAEIRATSRGFAMQAELWPPVEHANMMKRIKERLPMSDTAVADRKPVADSEQIAPIGSPLAVLPHGRGEKVLVVDDKPQLALQSIPGRR
jgi:hypothetical protein